jgi:formylglycine-generating enzyme required for sulfatase activity
MCTISIQPDEKTARSTNVSAQSAGMVLVPAGPLLMGSKDESVSERPIHEVYLDDFWMDETPVTNGQFAEFVKETGYQTEAERSGSRISPGGLSLNSL